MITITQSVNHTIFRDGDNALTFRQEAGVIHILTTTGDVSTLLPIVIAFPQAAITFARMNCPENVISTFARNGFAVFPSSDGHVRLTLVKP